MMVWFMIKYCLGYYSDDELDAMARHIEGGGSDNTTHLSLPETKDSTVKPPQDKISLTVVDKVQPQLPQPTTGVPDGTVKDSGASKPPIDGAEGDEEEGDVKKKKKKKKKKPEEEKKPKRAVKGAPIAEIKRLQAALKEEERQRQEEALRLQREEEERERQREEKVSMSIAMLYC